MLSQALTRYVDLHRSLGFGFRTQHSLLRNFVAFAEPHGDEFVRVGRVLDWAARAPSPPQRRNRLLTVRRFALAMQAEDARQRYRQPMLWGMRRANGELPTSIGQTRSSC